MFDLSNKTSHGELYGKRQRPEAHLLWLPASEQQEKSFSVAPTARIRAADYGDSLLTRTQVRCDLLNEPRSPAL